MTSTFITSDSFLSLPLLFLQLEISFLAMQHALLHITKTPSWNLRGDHLSPLLQHEDTGRFSQPSTKTTWQRRRRQPPRSPPYLRGGWSAAVVLWGPGKRWFGEVLQEEKQLLEGKDYKHSNSPIPTNSICAFSLPVFLVLSFECLLRCLHANELVC